MQVPPVLTAHLVKLENAAGDVCTGRISVEEFRTLVVHLEALFRRTLAEILEMDIPTDFAGELHEELTVGRQGVELYLDALQDFHRYIGERQFAALQEGLEKARVANQLVNEALRLNWVTYDTYRQAVQEYMSQMGGGGAVQAV